MTTTFGLTLPQRAALFGASTMNEMFDLAREADANPLIDSAWVGDSLMAKPRPESLTMLGALAGLTENLKLGVGCMASFPIRDPFVFASQWANLDFISNGRMLLAACTGIVRGGASAAEGANWGVLDKERAGRLEENIDIVRRLWTGETVSYDGKWTSYEGASIEPVPVQSPCPIWIASNPTPIPGRERIWNRALDRVARMADGWMTVQYTPGMLKTNWEKIRSSLIERGRDPDSFPTMAYHNINIGADRTACLEEAQRFLEAYYGPVFTPKMVESWTAAGTPDEIVAHLRQLIEDGAKTVTLRLTSWDQRGQYRRMTEEILPRLQEVIAG